jgi:acyl carrier protein/3-hydroxymyristoyl/3-hydroxydecanoyl-(acyl carrier protein) dehydratase
MPPQHASSKGTECAVLDRIREFVASAADRPLEDVRGDTDIYQELNVDSLGAMAIYIDLSHAFKIPEPARGENLALINTPKKLMEYVLRHHHGKREEKVGIRRKAQNLLARPSPYGDIFRFVGKVVSHDANKILTEMEWSRENPLIAAHFQGGPAIVPGVLLGEQVVQSAWLLSQAEGLVSLDEKLVLAQLHCDFRAPAFAPATVQAEVSLSITVKGSFGFTGVCKHKEVEVARIKGIAARPIAL